MRVKRNTLGSELVKEELPVVSKNGGYRRMLHGECRQQAKIELYRGRLSREQPRYCVWNHVRSGSCRSIAGNAGMMGYF